MPEPRRLPSRAQGFSILLGCFLALAVITVWETAESQVGYSWDVEIDSATGALHQVRIRDGDRRLKVERRGEVKISDDERGIERLGPDAYLIIDEREDRRRRRLEVTAGPDGRPELAWLVDREPAEFDAEARDWLAAVLPEIYRATGLDAEGRVGRLLAGGGAEAVLREITRIRSDSVQRLYFEQLLEQADLSDAELERVLRRSGRELGSDHELARVLRAIPVESLANEGVAHGFVAAAGAIGSDHELRQLLIEFVERPGYDPAVTEALLDATRSIGSDFDLAAVLMRLLDVMPEDSRSTPALAEALRSIGSDFELSRVLQKATSRGGLDRDELGELLSAAHGIGSDYELAQLLVGIAKDHTGELPEELFRLLRNIGGDHNLRRTLATVLARPDLTAGEIRSLLEAADGIGSDHEMAELLIELAERHGVDDAWRDAFDRAAATVGSDHQQGRIAAAARGESAG